LNFQTSKLILAALLFSIARMGSIISSPFYLQQLVFIPKKEKLLLRSFYLIISFGFI